MSTNQHHPDHGTDVGHGREESDHIVVHYSQAPDDTGNPESYSCDATDNTEINDRKEPNPRKLDRVPADPLGNEVYPILGRLDRDGLVRSEWVESAQGPPRKYYAITAAGRQLSDELRQDSKLLASLVQRKWKASRQAYWGGKKVFVRKGYRR